jgi:hypothetical protein
MDDAVHQVVAEYLRFKEVGRAAHVSRYCFDDGGQVELCSSNGRDWTVCLVRQPDSALTPLAYGSREAVEARYAAIMQRWDPALWPAPTAVIEGLARVFMPAGMSLLLGVIVVGRAALLLGVLKRAAPKAPALALLHFDGGRVTVVHVGSPLDLRSVHVDDQLALQGSKLEAQSREAATALLPAFARLLSRASAPSRRAGARNRGKGSVRVVVWAFVQLVRMGVEDLIGRLSDIEAQIKVFLPSLDLPREALGDVLAILLKIKTCLVSRAGRTIWHIRLTGLNDIESAIHKKFCAEAPTTLVDVCLAGRVCSPDNSPPRTRVRRKQPPAQAAGPDPAPTGTSTQSADAAPPDEAPEAPELLKFLRMVVERTGTK